MRIRTRITALLMGACAIFFGPERTATAEESFRPPILRKTTEATYPPLALRDRVEGSVHLSLEVTKEGRVQAVFVVASSTHAIAVADTRAPLSIASSTIADYGFVASATTAAASLEFSPATANDLPVPVRIDYTVRFVLPAQFVAPQAGELSSKTASAADTAELRGIVRIRGDRRRLAGASVRAFRDTDTQSFRETTTNGEGEFALPIPEGRWTIQVDIAGYFPFRTEESLRKGERIEVTYYVEAGRSTPYDIVVRADRPEREVNRRSLSIADIVRVPGTLGDPIQAVENLPGVARALPGSGAIIVRGSGPEDTGVFIDGIEVPLIYHFGGLRSVVPSDVIEGIDFFPGNYSAFYGRATGGILDAHIRRLQPDQVHGSIDVSLLDAGVFLQVPIGSDVAIGIAGRRSYIDAVLKAAIPDDSSVSLIAAPRYYDYQLLGDARLGNGHELRMFGLGSSDKLGLLFDNPADVDAQLQSGSLDTSTEFQRFSIAERYTDGNNFKNEIRISGGRDVISAAAFDQFRFEVEQQQFQLREMATFNPMESLSLSIGIDGIATIADVFVRAPRPPKEGDTTQNPDLTDVLVTELTDLVIWSASPFVEAEIRLTPSLKLIPGIRVDYFDAVDETSIDPRLVARYSLDDAWTIKGGIGWTHQAPLPQETDELFGNPDLGLLWAIQSSVGAEWKANDYLSFDATVFHKALRNLVSSTGETTERNGERVPLVYDNGGKGTVYGFEMFVEHKFSNNFRGWLSYTLSRAERTDSGDRDARLFSFDQTHILGLVASYVFPENWELGVRWRLVSGNPFTPVQGSVFLSDFDRYTFVPGSKNSDRLPMFHQLDIRLEKKWIYDVWSLSMYLSLVNAYAHENVEGFQYNFDFTQSEPVQGLPIFPILGVRAEL